MTHEPGNLLEDTHVVPDPQQADVFHANLSPRWNILYVFGGVTMATAVSAARAALVQKDFELLTATATYLNPVLAGPLVLRVRRLRAGKGSEQMAVELSAPNSAEPSLHVVVTFAPRRESDGDFTELVCPDVPGPEEAVPAQPPADYKRRRLPYHHSVEFRTVLGRLPWDRTWESEPARWINWYRYVQTPRLADGTLDPLAYVAACDMLGPALYQKRGPNAPPRMVVSLEISLHFFASTTSEWLLQDTGLYQSAAGYASGYVHLWDADRRLLAHGLQRALVRPSPF